MAGAVVSDVLTRASRFADSSVLPTDITQLVKSSLNRNRGSTFPIVQEIMGILNNLNCPDETEMQLLVESFIAEAIGVRAGGARGAGAPPNFGQLRFFWAARENLGKACF